MKRGKFHCSLRDSRGNFTLPSQSHKFTGFNAVISAIILDFLLKYSVSLKLQFATFIKNVFYIFVKLSPGRDSKL